jgi:putative protease
MVFGLFGKKESEEVLVGEVIHYFRKVKAAVVKVKENKVAVGDSIRVKGNTTDFTEKIKSMQIDHEIVNSASKGKEVAIQMKKKTRRGDRVFVLKEK